LFQFRFSLVLFQFHFVARAVLVIRFCPVIRLRRDTSQHVRHLRDQTVTEDDYFGIKLSSVYLKNDLRIRI